MVVQLGQGIFGRANDFTSHYHTEDFDGRFQGLRRWNGGGDVVSVRCSSQRIDYTSSEWVSALK
jgi:hypothetical protein